MPAVIELADISVPRRLTIPAPYPMLSIPRNGIGSTMNFVLQPWQLLLLILAGWINRQQQEVIEYLRTENQILIARQETHPAQR